ncbi:DUF1353 domain-containing protein, partial [Escherichia coli]|nr:DUF1353 domain-containing protein [Escherichia coli]
VWGISPRQPSGKNIIRWLLKKRTNGSVRYCQYTSHGRYAKAAIIHDWLYDNALRTKKEADRIFLDAMNVLEVPAWRRLMMYCAVHLFWRGNYKLAHQKTM